MEPDDPDGLEALYRVHRHDLLRFLTARVGDSGEADEILQDVWIRLRQVTATPIAHGRAYLYRMAQNLVVDRIRERQRRMQRERLWLHERAGPVANGMEPVDAAPNAEDVLLDREETARLVSALGSLPEGARRVFELHKVEGYSHADIAARLSISKSGVEKHMAVAMKHLRRALLD